MTQMTPAGLPNVKPNSGCSTFEVNQKMMDDTKKALKKADETVDKFIKTEEGKAKKEKVKKNLAIGLLGTIGLATAGTMLIKSGKVNKLVDAFKSLSRKTFADIEFNKGNATLKKSGKAFSGKIVDKLGNGDSVEMVYKNGVLQKSTRKGSNEFVKEFLYDDSSKISEIITKNRYDEKVQESLFENGKISSTRTYDETRMWHENGLLYYKGKRNGVEQMWDENGNLIINNNK